MHYVSSWGTTDKRILVHLQENVLETMSAHAQHRASDLEAGGILLGAVRGNNLEITFATTPVASDSRHPYLFERKSDSHREIAELLWLRSGGTIRYLGEWHTHPQDHPKPSSIDISEWRILVNKRVDKRPVLAIIVGRKSLHIELVYSNVSSSVLQPIS
ncbi:Mov34/MPN/PAD-1 family protein [compost metagenome]